MKTGRSRCFTAARTVVSKALHRLADRIRPKQPIDRYLPNWEDPRLGSPYSLFDDYRTQHPGHWPLHDTPDKGEMTELVTRPRTPISPVTGPEFKGPYWHCEGLRMVQRSYPPRPHKLGVDCQCGCHDYAKPDPTPTPHETGIDKSRGQC